MWKRLFIYLLTLIILGGAWMAVSSYGNTTVDLEKTKMALNTVNGTDADYAEYQGVQSSISYVQTYVPWLIALVFVCITYFMWRKPTIDVFQKIKTRV